jgi:hypothetical protein
MKREDFVKVVEETLDSLPREFRRRIRNVAVLVEDVPPNQPSRQLGQQRRLLLGIFHGVPTTKKSIFDLPMARDNRLRIRLGTVFDAIRLQEIFRVIGIPEEAMTELVYLIRDQGFPLYPRFALIPSLLATAKMRTCSVKSAFVPNVSSKASLMDSRVVVASWKSASDFKPEAFTRLPPAPCVL